jgi:hypothetical protein
VHLRDLRASVLDFDAHCNVLGRTPAHHNLPLSHWPDCAAGMLANRFGLARLL